MHWTSMLEDVEMQELEMVGREESCLETGLWRLRPKLGSGTSGEEELLATADGTT